MLSILPPSAHGDTLPVCSIEPAYSGKGEARHVVGAKVTGLLPFASCAQVPITLQGLDISKLPSQEVVSEHNMNLQFLIARFRGLQISFRGGDYGTIIYTGTALGVEFLNLNPPATPAK